MEEPIKNQKSCNRCHTAFTDKNSAPSADLVDSNRNPLRTGNSGFAIHTAVKLEDGSNRTKTKEEEVCESCYVVDFQTKYPDAPIPQFS